MSMMVYEDLDVYQLAFDKALLIHRYSLTFPKIEQFGGMADQIRRSSKSVCANIAEGLSKQMSLADKTKFLRIALGSAEETRVWLSFSEKLGYLSSEDVTLIRDEYTRISQMLFQLQQKLKF